jgi:hypothetical protein
VLVFKDILYLLDPAAPAFGPLVKCRPKLVEIDLINNTIKVGCNRCYCGCGFDERKDETSSSWTSINSSR